MQAQAGRLEQQDTATAFRVLLAISLGHFLNDLMQSLLPAVYPILRASYQLDFGQIGLIALTYQLTGSLLQPLVGLYTDRRPQPYSLAAGMCFTLCGLLLLADASSYAGLLLAAALIGTGSSVFHPESSRVARMASGGQHGLAQSVFQVGGNAGAAVGPLLAALVVLPGGQRRIAWFSLVALLGVVVLARVGRWYSAQRRQRQSRRPGVTSIAPPLPPAATYRALGVLALLMCSKFLYTASLSNYYAFYLIDHFHVSVKNAQLHLFAYLASVALGTLVGGPIGDRIGRKRVIWVSILGILPFTLLLPHADLYWTGILTAIIGFTLASAFPTIVVYAQELLPGQVGMVAGLFFGLAFGIAGVGAAGLGHLADVAGLEFVYQLCAFLPLIGLCAVFLPDLHPRVRPRRATA